jgi:DNA repair exonuclease SbcCD nuclease subunit
VTRILQVNDIHAADRPPSSCTEEYTEDIFDLLGETVGVAVEYQVSAVVWTGDVFNSKAPARNSHWLVKRLARVGRAYDLPWYIVPGNHDMQHDRLDSIHDTQPLGDLFGWSNGPKMLVGQCREFQCLYGVPWLQEWTNETVGEALRGFREEWVQGKRLVCAHVPLYPPGTELPYEYYDAVMWASAMGNIGYCAYGHVHEYHGTWECAGVTFHNPGALSRGSLHEYNMTRPVKVSVWDSADGSFTEVELLKAKPAEQVFRLREKQQLTDTAGKLDDFLARVGSTRLEVLSVEAVLEHVRTRNVGKDVEDEVAELLDWSRHQE